MANDLVITVTNVHKNFKVFFDKGATLKERLLFRNRNHYENRHVLRGISFTVKKGEAVGIIGQNGSGKSTLLKLMTKIMYPDQGSVEITGRISSLLELGAGFHPDMSGRENIYLNASIFGLTKKEIDRRLHEIIEFSELQDYIDNPVRTYSSGMYMRLAFSVAIHVDADILLIDEILAVGDLNFQTKCFHYLRELQAKGVTIVLVTHDINTINEFCGRALWLNEGVVFSVGHSKDVTDNYLNFINTKKHESMVLNIIEDDKLEQNENEEINKSEPLELLPAKIIDYNANRFGFKEVEIVKAVIASCNDKGLMTGEPAKINIHYKVNKPVEECVFGMGFYTLNKECLYGTNTQMDQLRIKNPNKTGIIEFFIGDLPLLPGVYILQVAVVDIDGIPFDYYRDYSHFEVTSTKAGVGIMYVDHKWILNDRR